MDSLSESPAFQEWVGKEFPEGAQLLDEVGRRGFIKVMAASFGLAGLGMTGCRRPEHTILPYGKSPEELIPECPIFMLPHNQLQRDLHQLSQKVIRVALLKLKATHPLFLQVEVLTFILRRVC